MLAWPSSGQIPDVEFGIDGVLDLDGVDDCANVNRCWAAVEPLAVQRSHYFGCIMRAILLAKPGLTRISILEFPRVMRGHTIWEILA